MVDEKYREAYEQAFPKKEKGLDSLGAGLAMVGLTAGLGSILLGGMNKMFGEQEKIPKGVVKEMMHGVMAGVQDMIAEKDYDIKELKDQLERKDNDLKEVKEERDAVRRRYDELMQFAEDMKAKEKAKKPYTGKKRGPKPKKVRGKPGPKPGAKRKKAKK